MARGSAGPRWLAHRNALARARLEGAKIDAFRAEADVTAVSAATKLLGHIIAVGGDVGVGAARQRALFAGSAQTHQLGLRRRCAAIAQKDVTQAVRVARDQ